ncbi:MAG: DUF2703 domain-containing protein [Lachnospiraceae bacterium]|nr:DUF2703 domain-containing protein [Lachnospiraceae bacterium]
MAEKWYPVIDYMECAECGSCIAKCTHGVYDLTKSPTPVVVNPLGCVDHCHGCGNQCPQGAITYVGDNTGWTPPKGLVPVKESCCCGDAKEEKKVKEAKKVTESKKTKKVRIEYLYLDLQTCDRCIGTDKVLEEALEEVTPALNAAGYYVEYKKVEISSIQLAEKYHFLSSPTILVNGHDICPSVKENACDCCSDISGTAVDCRVFEYEGKNYEVPPKQMLAEAILHGAFTAPNEDSACYTLPENLRNFFEGKKNKNCCCSDGCC